MAFELKSTDGFRYAVCGNPASHQTSALCIYYLGLPQALDALFPAFATLDCPIVYIVIDDWDNQLTPWPAKGLYPGDPDFKGEADTTLHTLVDDLIPHIEEAEGLAPSKRAISGYSLGGLFATYAFANCDVFEKLASMSGSFWYEGWIEYLEGLHPNKQECFAYLSIGNKESKAREKILHSVQANTDKTAAILESWGAQVENRLVPGTHFDNVLQRVMDGLRSLLR